MPNIQNNIELRQKRTCCMIKTPVEHRQRAPVAGKWKLSVEKQQLFHMVRKKRNLGCCGIFSFQFSFPLQLRLTNYPGGEATQRQSWSLFCFYSETTTTSEGKINSIFFRLTKNHAYGSELWMTDDWIDDALSLTEQKLNDSSEWNVSGERKFA